MLAVSEPESLSISTAIFPDEPGLVGYIEAKIDDGITPNIYRPDALHVAQPTALEQSLGVWARVPKNIWDLTLWFNTADTLRLCFQR